MSVLARGNADGFHADWLLHGVSTDTQTAERVVRTV